MTHVSPTAFLTWSVLSCALGAFLIGHLWRFDRFKCLKWSDGAYKGSFKRLMIYTYLLSIPMTAAYAIGFTWIKYAEGYRIRVGGSSVTPTPYLFWPPVYQRAVFPLMLVFSLAWAFEMVTHLEELCFWLFLMTTGPTSPNWLRSPYFKIWATGSIIALIYMPLVTVLFKSNPTNCEVYTFLAGSSGDFALTSSFIPILWAFPKFLTRVKEEGVDETVVIRLRKFYELNVIRIVFRCIMFVPLFILGMDGVVGHEHHINESFLWTDLLSMLAGFGCAFSSVCTILIFFPRSYEAEYRADEATRHSPTSPRSTRMQKEEINSSNNNNSNSRLASRLKHFGIDLSGKRSRVSRVFSRIRVPLPVRRRSSALSGASDITPFAYPLTDKDIRNSNEPMKEVGGLARSGTKATYLLTDSPVLKPRDLDIDGGPQDVEHFSLYSAADIADARLSGVLAHRQPARKGTDEDVLWLKREEPTSKAHATAAADDEANGDNPFLDPIPRLPPLPRISYHSSSFMPPLTPRSANGKKRRSKTLPSRPASHSFSFMQAARQRAGWKVPPMPPSAASSVLPLTSENLRQHNSRVSMLNPLVLTFTSPMDALTRQEEKPKVFHTARNMV